MKPTPKQKECASYGHRWVTLGYAKDGTRFARCKLCGLESENCHGNP